MNALELLNKYDKIAAAIRQHFTDKLMSSLETDDVTEEFKTFVRAQTIDNEQVAKIVDSNPRALFDIFDKYGYYVETLFMESMFHFTIVNNGEIVLVNDKPFDRRIDCDREAMEGAMKLINDSL